MLSFRIDAFREKLSTLPNLVTAWPLECQSLSRIHHANTVNMSNFDAVIFVFQPAFSYVLIARHGTFIAYTTGESTLRILHKSLPQTMPECRIAIWDAIAKSSPSRQDGRASTNLRKHTPDLDQAICRCAERTFKILRFQCFSLTKTLFPLVLKAPHSNGQC